MRQYKSKFQEQTEWKVDLDDQFYGTEQEEFSKINIKIGEMAITVSRVEGELHDQETSKLFILLSNGWKILYRASSEPTYSQNIQVKLEGKVIWENTNSDETITGNGVHGDIKYSILQAIYQQLNLGE